MIMGMEWLRRTTRNAAAWGMVNDSVLSVMCCANREFIFDSDSEQQETSLCQRGFQRPHPRVCEQNQPAEEGREAMGVDAERTYLMPTLEGQSTEPQSDWDQA